MVLKLIDIMRDTSTDVDAWLPMRADFHLRLAGICFGMKQQDSGYAELEKEQNRSVFTEEECDALFALIKRRNFWAHECFTSLEFDTHTGALKNPEDMHRMAADLRDAEEWKEKLFNKQRQC